MPRRRDYKQELELLMLAAGLPAPEREYRFAPPRRWRFDYAWPDYRLAVEYEGIYQSAKSRHLTLKGYENDCEKYNAATVAGWRVLRFTAEMVSDGRALSALEALIEQEANYEPTNI